MRLAAEVGALGVVFGDIGTSPLYAFKTALAALGTTQPSVDDVLGLLSLVVWALTLSVTIKYVTVVLRADNDGEGGILALITLLNLHRAPLGAKRILLGIGLIGAAMLFGDGMLTPAISVLSAVEGLRVFTPSMQTLIVPLTVGILLALFVSQRFGTEGIGRFFGPVMVVWFLTIGAFGVMEVARDPSVFQALNPIYGIKLLMNHTLLAGEILGAVFLVLTGGEALYADLGHFGRTAISRAWLYVAMPAIILNYFGQGALVLGNPQAGANPFYELVPKFAGNGMVVLATAATIIASQAIITGAFSLAKQAIEIGYLPPMGMRYTSHHTQAHVVVPRVNLFLGMGTLGIVVGFGSSDSLASAYGIAVSIAMITTTILLVAEIRRAWRWSPPFVYALGLAMLGVDVPFFLANLSKIHDGGWLPLTIGLIIIFLMASWRRGVARVVEEQMRLSEPLDAFARREARATNFRSTRPAIFLSRAGAMAPVALARLYELLDMSFDKVVIASVWIASRPRVPVSERVVLTTLDERLIRVDLRYGYMQVINVPSILAPALRRAGLEPEEAVYIIGHERILAPEGIGGYRDLTAHVFAFLARNAERAVDRFDLPRRRTLEIGYTVKL
ncbi:KUP system potassium uptake protein [Rhizobiales bacterium GAS113]|nr:KUP system potassium uptake protein [Rhizobiales bacterium GAS113]